MTLGGSRDVYPLRAVCSLLWLQAFEIRPPFGAQLNGLQSQTRLRRIRIVVTKTCRIAEGSSNIIGILWKKCLLNALHRLTGTVETPLLPEISRVLPRSKRSHCSMLLYSLRCDGDPRPGVFHEDVCPPVSFIFWSVLSDSAGWPFLRFLTMMSDLHLTSWNLTHPASSISHVKPSSPYSRSLCRSL